MIDLRHYEAQRHNDAKGRGWDFSEDRPTSYGILRNIPALICLAVVLASVVGILVMVSA